MSSYHNIEFLVVYLFPRVPFIYGMQDYVMECSQKVIFFVNFHLFLYPLILTYVNLGLLSLWTYIWWPYCKVISKLWLGMFFGFALSEFELTYLLLHIGGQTWQWMILWTYKQWLTFLVISSSCLSLIEILWKVVGCWKRGFRF